MRLGVAECFELGLGVEVHPVRRNPVARLHHDDVAGGDGAVLIREDFDFVGVELRVFVFYFNTAGESHVHRSDPSLVFGDDAVEAGDALRGRGPRAGERQQYAYEEGCRQDLEHQRRATRPKRITRRSPS